MVSIEGTDALKLVTRSGCVCAKAESMRLAAGKNDEWNILQASALKHLREIPIRSWSPKTLYLLTQFSPTFRVCFCNVSLSLSLPVGTVWRRNVCLFLSFASRCSFFRSAGSVFTYFCLHFSFKPSHIQAWNACIHALANGDGFNVIAYLTIKINSRAALTEFFSGFPLWCGNAEY